MAFHHGYHTVHLPIHLWIQSGRAASHQDLDVGVLATGSADEPPGVGVGLIGDGTRVDDAELGVPEL
jgi:hypothetical protein